MLDPDGLEPAEHKAMGKRAFSRGQRRDGLVHGTYSFLPEIAAKFDRLFDACLSPRTAGVFLTEEEARDASAEPRTLDQQRHDIVAAMVDGYARSGDAPTIGGAAPTILVSVRADDLATGRGAAHIDGIDTPVSLQTARQYACTGGTQSICIDSNG